MKLCNLQQYPFKIKQNKKKTQIITIALRIAVYEECERKRKNSEGEMETANCSFFSVFFVVAVVVIFG